METSDSSKPWRILKGQAEAVQAGRRTKFVLSNWTSAEQEVNLPESIPTVITSWRVPPPFEGRLVEVVGHMGHWWNKQYLVARSLRIAQMGYEVQRINFRRLFAVLALVILLPSVLLGSLVLYRRYRTIIHEKEIASLQAVAELNLENKLSTLNGKDIYLCGTAYVDQNDPSYLRDFPRLVPLRVVRVIRAHDKVGPELAVQMPDRVRILTIVDDSTDFNQVLIDSSAYMAVPKAFTDDEIAHIRQRTPIIGMSLKAVECAMGYHEFLDEHDDVIKEKFTMTPVPIQVVSTAGKVTSIVPIHKPTP